MNKNIECSGSVIGLHCILLCDSTAISLIATLATTVVLHINPFVSPVAWRPSLNQSHSQKIDLTGSSLLRDFACRSPTLLKQTIQLRPRPTLLFGQQQILAGWSSVFRQTATTRKQIVQTCQHTQKQHTKRREIYKDKEAASHGNPRQRFAGCLWYRRHIYLSHASTDSVEPGQLAAI